MKNFRFYVEYDSTKEKRKATRKNLGNHTGNCLAILLDGNKPLYHNNSTTIDCISGVSFIRNSNCCFSGCSTAYLHNNCKRISEKQAKEIHPKLFNYLNN